MVIVEYCKHGNLSSYLKSKRGEYSPYKVDITLMQLITCRLHHGNTKCVRCGDIFLPTKVPWLQMKPKIPHRADTLVSG